MSRAYKFRNPDGVYFVSFAVVEWLDVFSRKDYVHILIESLQYCQRHKGMEIFAWCIMTNHVHLVFRSSGERRPGELLGDFKRFTSNKIVRAIREHPGESRRKIMLEQFKKSAEKCSNVWYNQFWRHDNHPIELWSNRFISQKINYIHNNPVKAGFVRRAEEYRYSSAVDYSGETGLLEGVIVLNIW